MKTKRLSIYHGRPKTFSDSTKGQLLERKLKNNILHTIYTDFSDPIEGLRRVTAMLEFLVEINKSDMAENLSSTSKEGALVIIELTRKILNQLSETL